jgi:hypothetical protein
VRKAAGFAGACACALAVACGPGAELVGDAAVEAGERLMDAGAALRDGEVARADDGGAIPEPAGEWVDVPCVEYRYNVSAAGFSNRRTAWIATLRDDRISIATGRTADLLLCDQFSTVRYDSGRDAGVSVTRDAGVSVETNVMEPDRCDNFPYCGAILGTSCTRGNAQFTDGRASVVCRFETVSIRVDSDGTESTTTQTSGHRVVRMRVAAE